ncbi:MAG: hypothetical protein HJJLKODD_01736 [Phycisphaerae bacterium]|nr:hypothetical protein [Phycisphaerae bacterium]
MRQSVLETAWRIRPIRAVLQAYWWAVRHPVRLWSQYQLHTHPRVLLLVLFALLQWQVFSRGWEIVGQGQEWLMNSLADYLNSSAGFVYYMRTPELFPRVISYRPITIGELWMFLFCWPLATLAGLMLFFQSNRAFKVRFAHLLQIFIHATALPSLLLIGWVITEMLLDSLLFFRPAWIIPLNQWGYARNLQLWMIAGGVAFWFNLWMGYQRFLRMPRGWGVAGLSLILGYLLSAVVMICIR